MSVLTFYVFPLMMRYNLMNRNSLFDYKVDENNVRVLGRSIYRNGIRYLSYSCSAVEFDFTGTSVYADIWTDWTCDEPWKWIFQGYAAVFINNSETPSIRFALNPGINEYLIFKSDLPVTITIRIMKMSEAAFGKMGIICIKTDGIITPTKPKAKRIEFIGDSITCGYGIEGVWNKDTFNTKQENPWIAYAASTARTLDMDFNLISWSGIGIVSSWVEPDIDEPLNCWLMPELYDYTDKGLENTLGITNDYLKEVWDNKLFPPNFIVLNLGTNDSSYTRNINYRIKDFGIRYLSFLRKIRSKNPESFIICTLGEMGNELFPEIELRVLEINDNKIIAFPFDLQLESDGIGADWHPNRVTHNKMTEKLVKLINDLS